MPHKYLTLQTADGQTVGAYLAEPEGKPKGGIVVVQEIFGVNPHIRSVVDGYAAAGYLAIAPAVFDTLEKDVQLGYDEAGRTKGIALVSELGFDRALASVKAAASAFFAASRRASSGAVSSPRAILSRIERAKRKTSCWTMPTACRSDARV